MKLIAESGSTRTEWALVEDNHLIQRVFTEGLNPFSKQEGRLAGVYVQVYLRFSLKRNQSKYTIMEPDVLLMKRRIYWVHHQQHNLKLLSKQKAIFLQLPAVCSNAKQVLPVFQEQALTHAFMTEKQQLRTSEQADIFQAMRAVERCWAKCSCLMS